MPFNYLLTNLLVDVPSAVGAIFLDQEGEAIEWVTRHGDPYDLKVEGAYHTIFRRARQDPANREFFESVPPATLGDFVPSIIAIAGIGLLGLVLHVSGSQGWLALGAVLFAIAALAYQIELTRRYFERSISNSHSSQAAA